MNPVSQNWKEVRRLHAWRLKQQGWSQRQIAEALGVSEGAVSQWMRRARQRDEATITHWRQETWPALQGPGDVAQGRRCCQGRLALDSPFKNG